MCVMQYPGDVQVVISDRSRLMVTSYPRHRGSAGVSMGIMATYDR